MPKISKKLHHSPTPEKWSKLTEKELKELMEQGRAIRKRR